MSIITSALIALSLASPVTEKVFTPLVSFENYTLSLDLDSIKILGTPKAPLVTLDMQMVLSPALEHSEIQKPIKSYVNTVAVDCKADVMHVLVSRAFGTEDDLLFTSTVTNTIQNPKDVTRPVTIILNFVCQPIEKIEKDKSNPSNPLKNAKDFTKLT